MEVVSVPFVFGKVYVCIASIALCQQVTICYLCVEKITLLGQAPGERRRGGVSKGEGGEKGQRQTDKVGTCVCVCL